MSTSTLRALEKEAENLVLRGALNGALDAKFFGDERPLYTAARLGLADLGAALIARGAKVDRGRERPSEPPLCIAARNGHVAFVRLLLDRGADPSKPNHDRATPLIQAAGRGDDHGLEIVRMLVAAGADTKASAGNQWTASRAADGLRKNEIRRALISAGKHPPLVEFRGSGRTRRVRPGARAFVEHAQEFAARWALFGVFCDADEARDVLGASKQVKAIHRDLMRPQVIRTKNPTAFLLQLASSDWTIGVRTFGRGAAADFSAARRLAGETSKSAAAETFAFSGRGHAGMEVVHFDEGEVLAEDSFESGDVASADAFLRESEVALPALFLRPSGGLDCLVLPDLTHDNVVSVDLIEFTR